VATPPRRGTGRPAASSAVARCMLRCWARAWREQGRGFVVARQGHIITRVSREAPLLHAQPAASRAWSRAHVAWPLAGLAGVAAPLETNVAKARALLAQR
jgi:hypothetical protein